MNDYLCNHTSSYTVIPSSYQDFNLSFKIFLIILKSQFPSDIIFRYFEEQRGPFWRKSCTKSRLQHIFRILQNNDQDLQYIYQIMTLNGQRRVSSYTRQFGLQKKFENYVSITPARLILANEWLRYNRHVIFKCISFVW